MRSLDPMPGDDGLDMTWMDDRLEAFVDGTLPPEEQAAFEHALEQAATEEGDARRDHLAADLLLAEQIRDDLRALPTPSCPPQVTEAVMAEARRDHAAVRRHRWRALWSSLREAFTGLVRGPAWRPALALSVVVGALAVVTLWPARPAAAPTDAEVSQALAEAKWALGYVAEVGRTTGRTVRHDVLESHVLSPVNDAVHGLTRPPAAPSPRTP